MATVSVIWIIVAFVIGVLIGLLIAWLFWQQRAADYERRVSDLQAEVDRQNHLLRQQEASIDQLEGRVRESILAQGELEKRLAQSADSSLAPDQGGQDLEARDDLKRIEGIGPKISQLLDDAGIHTFTELAATDADRLAQIVQDGGVRLADPTTWPQQANLAAAGEWDELQVLQDRLKGGRLV